MRCTTLEATRVPPGGARMNRGTHCRDSILSRRLPGQKGDEPSWRVKEPGLTDIQPLRSKTPRRGRRDTSDERGLTKAREAHQKVLATVATLEEEIEWLSQSITQSWSEACTHSRSQDCHRWKSQGWNRRYCWVPPEESPAPYFEYNLPSRGPASDEEEEDLLDFDLEDPLGLGLQVDHFLQGPADSSEEEDRKRSSPEPPVEDLESWVTWRAWVHDMPDWWQELTEVPGIDDHKKLAWEVWASFELPQQISKQHHVENYHQAPLALPCICWKSFLLSHDSKFACQDIRELEWEKMVAYAQALQFWAEKASLPTQSQPHLLAECSRAQGGDEMLRLLP